MNTNEASLGQSTVQTYSTTEKTDLERAVFALECAARWLDNGSDPAQAAEEIRLVIAQIKGCIANCEANSDPADGRHPAAIAKALADAINTGTGMVKVSYVDPSDYAEPSVEQDERVALDVSVLARLSAQIFDCPLNPTISKFARAVEANIRAASTSGNVAQGAEAVCQTCKGHGMIGGPSYYAPDEGGEPCPDCVPPAQTALTDAAQRLLRQAKYHLEQHACEYGHPAQTELIDAIGNHLTAAQSASRGQA